MEFALEIRFCAHALLELRQQITEVACLIGGDSGNPPARAEVVIGVGDLGEVDDRNFPSAGSPAL